MQETDNILEMRGITKAFPGVKALDNVNFSVKRGEVHCLIGANGAGKSTLMKVLSGAWCGHLRRYIIFSFRRIIAGCSTPMKICSRREETTRAW